jgi:hypothetical protein
VRCRKPSPRGDARTALAAAAALALTLGAAPAAGQAVSGQVLDSLSGAPVGQGYVVLLDAERREVFRTLSTYDGRFTLEAPAPGLYRVRSEVVAYRAWESEPIGLGTGQRVAVVLRILRVPVRLDAIRVTGERRCLPPDRTVDMAALWEEARKALAGAAWSASRDEFVARLHRYRRARGADRPRSRTWVSQGRATQPFRAVAPERLVESGYVEAEGDGRVYYGPDADVLLHPSFQESHCFSAIRGRGPEQGLIGLEFTPDGKRSTADIAGVLWIDAASSELRKIEFQYTDLPFPFKDDRLGGTIEFQRAVSGAWILSEWQLRMPILGLQRYQLAPGVAGTRHVLEGIQETGGEIVELFDLEGRLEYASPHRTTVSGTLFDLESARPVAQATVLVDETGYRARTDERGAFVLRSRLEGRHRITTARLDSLRYLPGVGTLTFEPGGFHEPDFLVPSLETVHRFLCGGNGVPRAERAVVGRVLEGSTLEPLGDLTVEVRWVTPGEALAGGTEMERARSTTDDEGNYVVCGLPVGRRLVVGVASRNWETSGRSIRFADDGVEVGPQSERHAAPDGVFRVDLLVTPIARR